MWDTEGSVIVTEYFNAKRLEVLGYLLAEDRWMIWRLKFHKHKRRAESFRAHIHGYVLVLVLGEVWHPVRHDVGNLIRQYIGKISRLLLDSERDAE